MTPQPSTPAPSTPERPAFVMLNGQIVPFAEARISIMAPGLTFAATVFEGMRAYWNEGDGQLYVFRLQDHLRRQDFSMKLIELDKPPSAEETDQQVLETLRANRLREDCYIRKTIAPDPTLQRVGS